MVLKALEQLMNCYKTFFKTLKPLVDGFKILKTIGQWS